MLSSYSIYYSENVRFFNSIVKLRFLILVGLIITNCVNSFGQSKSLQFKHLSIDNGLSSTKALCALQDHKGFMWVGTDDGLNRYDGNNVVTYRNIESDSGSISGNYIRAIFRDHNNNLLIAPNGGLSMYDRELDRFINFRNQKSSVLFNLDIVVKSIAEDSIGNLWLATTEALLYFDRNNNKLVTYKNEPEKPNSINENYITCVYIDRVGRLWLTTRKGIDLFIPKTNIFSHLTWCKTHQEDLPDTYFLSIVEDKEGNMWFGGADGLFCLENNPSNKNQELNHFVNNPNDPNSISKERIKALIVDDSGDLFIGTENGGINIYDKNKKCFLHFQTDEFNSMSLNNESINWFALDNNNNLWVCTHGGGVNISVKNSSFI